jgi:hypothetical protein
MSKKKKIIVLANCHGLEIQRYLKASRKLAAEYEVLYIANYTNMDDPRAAEYVHKELRTADVLISQNVQSVEWLRNENLVRHLQPACDFIRLVFWRFDGYWPINLPRNSESFWFLPTENPGQTFAEYISAPLPKQQIRENFERSVEKLREIDADSDCSMFDFFEANHRSHQLFSDYWHPTAFFFQHLITRILKRLGVDEHLPLLRNDCVNRDRYRFISDAVVDEVGLSYDQTFVNFHDILVTREVFFDFSRQVAHTLRGVGTHEVREAFDKWAADTGRRPRLVSVADRGLATQSSISQWSSPGEAQLALTGRPTGRFAFHTDRESRPWWQLSFKSFFEISALKVWNRGDGDASLKERAVPLSVLYSNDEREWRKIAVINYTFGGANDGCPLDLKLAFPIVAKHLRLQVGRASYLHLDQVDAKVKAVTTSGSKL